MRRDVKFLTGRLVLPRSGYAAAVATPADAAQAYLSRRRHLLVRLERVEQALRRWDAWETNALLPEELRRPASKPILGRPALDGLQRMLTEELARLDGKRGSES
jgi:hypothetical protein